MSKAKLSPSRIRELAVFRYRNALEHGDFDTVAAVLKIAENDLILWAMIDDLSAVDEGIPERPAMEPIRPPRNDKHITQIITVRDPSSNGQTPKTDHSQEENEMMHTAIESSIPERPRTLNPFTMRFITLVAALFVVILIGGLLIEMVSDPIDGYPALVSLQTEEPKCSVDTITDPDAEAERLGNAADDVLDKQRREGAELATLLAICGLQTGYAAEADEALQRGLDILGGAPTFPDHDIGNNTSVFSPDGQQMLVGGYYEATLWDIATHTKIHSFPYDREGRLRSNPVAFSPDGKWIVTFHQMGFVRIWDAATGETIRDLDVTEASTVVAPALSSMVFSPDGAHLLLGLIDGNVQIWDVNAGTLERAFQAGSDIVVSLMYAPDGRHALINIFNETTARLWDTETEQVIRDFSDDTSPLFNSAALSPDGRFVLTSGEAGTAILYNAETGDPISTLGGFDGDLTVGAFSPDGQYALVGASTPTALLFDLETGAVIRRFVRNVDVIASALFSPDGNSVLLGNAGGSVRLWPTSVEGMIALACANITRDFTVEERADYGLGDGAACPAA